MEFSTTLATTLGSSTPSENLLDEVIQRVDGALERIGVSNHNNLEEMEENNACKTLSEDFEEELETRPETPNDPTRSSQEDVLMNLQDFTARMGTTPISGYT